LNLLEWLDSEAVAVVVVLDAAGVDLAAVAVVVVEG